MADPVDPVSPVPPPPIAGASVNPGTTGLPSNVAAALACIPLIGGIIFYILEKRDQFVRFYAMQSIIFGGAWIMFSIVHQIVYAIFNAVPGLRYLLLMFLTLIWVAVSLVFLVIFIISVIKAFSGVRW